MAKLKHMFKKTAVLFRDREDRNQEKKEPSAPEGLWLKCPKCGEVVYRDDVKAHGYVCPKCEGYFRIGTRTRIRMVADTAFGFCILAPKNGSFAVRALRQ